MWLFYSIDASPLTDVQLVVTLLSIWIRFGHNNQRYGVPSSIDRAICPEEGLPSLGFYCVLLRGRWGRGWQRKRGGERTKSIYIYISTWCSYLWANLHFTRLFGEWPNSRTPNPWFFQECIRHCSWIDGLSFGIISSAIGCASHSGFPVDRMKTLFWAANF